MAEDPVLVPVKRLNLIPVGLKEAALDSPTFRATATHFGDNIDAVERWLDGYVKAVSKLVAEMNSLEPLVNAFLACSNPPHQISEAVLDHDYTLLAMQRYSEGAREFWNHTLRGAKRYDTLIVEPIKSFMNGDLKAFKEARRTLDTTQRNFDSVISRYLGQNKTKEASSLREDAFQLHEARKAYLKASMDMCVLAPQVRNAIDKLIVKVFCEQWKDLRASREAHTASFARWGSEMERIRGWSREMENSERAFKRELNAARKQIEDSAEQVARPSRELEDYAASTVPYLGTGASSGAGSKTKAGEKPEKQGWLYLRTVTGRPPRTLWSRRWFFVKNGIFGWLVQGTRSGGVEESEKIGVLLCSVRPAVQEERRFCFEVKTSDASIILQAETQQELADWIASFEVAKRKALEDPASTALSPAAPGVDPAFAISPPVAPELAAKNGDGHVTQGSEDNVTGLLMPEKDSAHQHRASFDLGGARRVTSPEREGERTREHASRIIQKLDIHKRSNTSIQPGSPTPSSSGVGGIASLISASHNVLPVGLGPAQTPVDIAKRSFTLPTSSLAPSTLANPPAPTNLSHTAMVVGGERGTGLGRNDGNAIPSGILANLWGSSNWAYVNRLDDDITPTTPTLPSGFDVPAATRDDSIVMDGQNDTPKVNSIVSAEMSGTSLHRKAASVGNTISAALPAGSNDDAANEYPSNYPVPLRAQNAQFRMLFPQVPASEKVVLVFRATWNPNEQQEFPGRVYVTARQIYFFSNHLGLVLITSVRLKMIREVTSAPGRDCDFLYLLLRDSGTQGDPQRVAIKIFLEPLKLLQRRLNFLVENVQERSPMDLVEIVTKLIKMEVEVPQRSSSVESWEDVAFDGEDAGDDKNSSQRATGRNVKASLRIDGNIFGDPAKTGREIQKFKLPNKPVIYTPKGMQGSITREFSVSAKALFHVMFGDRSAVFQVLYCNRWADKVSQTPWIRNEGGNWKRSFASQYHATPMADTQEIEIFNDHLCYVVTNIKNPWRLPHSKSFTLMTKFVITHVAKSRCKLAIFQSVQWSKPPRTGYIKHLIEREALNALEADALDLTTVSMDQVAKLGHHSKTNKSLDIFGSIGISKQAAQMDVTQAPNLGGSLTLSREQQRRHISIYRLVLNDILTKLLGFVSFIFDIIVALGKSALAVCTTHTLLVSILAVSALYNTWHGYRDGLTWYQDRSATAFMSRMGVAPAARISKAIYLADINDLISTSVDNDTVAALSSPPSLHGHKTCRSTFSEKLALSMETLPSSGLSARLARTRENIARYRNDLLVALRVVNRVERDVVLAEWNDWVISEDKKCARVQSMLLLEDRNSEVANKPDSSHAELGGSFLEYCNSCRKELSDLSSGIDLI